MANTYPAGDVVQLASQFSVNGVATDPTTITLYIKSPSGLQILVYGSSNVTRAGTGLYQYEFTTSQSGGHFYRWVGTGAVIAANESSFVVGPSNFV